MYALTRLSDNYIRRYNLVTVRFSHKDRVTLESEIPLKKRINALMYLESKLNINRNPVPKPAIFDSHGLAEYNCLEVLSRVIAKVLSLPQFKRHTLPHIYAVRMVEDLSKLHIVVRTVHGIQAAINNDPALAGSSAHDLAVVSADPRCRVIGKQFDAVRRPSV